MLKGGKNQRTQTKQLGTWSYTPNSDNKHMYFHYWEVGCVWKRMGESLRSSSPDLWGLGAPRAFPPPHNGVPSPLSTPLPDCHFPFSCLGDVFLGNIAKTAAGIFHDNPDSTHSSENRLRAGHQQLLLSRNIIGPPSQREFSNRAGNQDPMTL